jgi:lipooligosaccharide transport system permease protein
LLATTTMQLGESESLWPVLAAIKWIRTYQAAVATPLEPEDILYGKLAWVVTRSLATGVVYTIVIASFGALQSWWCLTLPLIGALITLAFAAPLVAFAATAQSDGSFVTIYRFGFVPMFLFSATFYPVSAYPGYLRPVVQFIPLYHGVALARGAAFGEGSFSAIILHVTFLVVMVVTGITWGRHTMRRRLVD